MLPTDFSARFEAELAKLYVGKETVLHEAILYSLLGPGKRLRPKLSFLAALAGGATNQDDAWQKSICGMLAVEMVHCYSLVHDDLPAMDNDDFRRGRLSCHKKYGEAVGILVGDALIADAFAVLSGSEVGALEQVRELAMAIGSSGMVLGQEFDLTTQSRATTWEKWREIHALKTGRLFECACVMGGLSAGADLPTISKLRDFARAFGIAFQLKDDLHDDADTVSLLGRAQVERLLNENVQNAILISRELASEGLMLAARQLLGLTDSCHL